MGATRPDRVTPASDRAGACASARRIPGVRVGWTPGPARSRWARAPRRRACPSPAAPPPRVPGVRRRPGRGEPVRRAAHRLTRPPGREARQAWSSRAKSLKRRKTRERRGAVMCEGGWDGKIRLWFCGEGSRAHGPTLPESVWLPTERRSIGPRRSWRGVGPATACAARAPSPALKKTAGRRPSGGGGARTLKTLGQCVEPGRFGALAGGLQHRWPWSRGGGRRAAWEPSCSSHRGE